MKHLIKPKSARRNVVCHVFDPISFATRIVALRSGTALVYLPKVDEVLQKCCAAINIGCLEAQQAHQQEKPEGVHPEVKMESVGRLVVSDPNSSPEAKAFFSPNIHSTGTEAIVSTLTEGTGNS